MSVTATYVAMKESQTIVESFMQTGTAIIHLKIGMLNLRDQRLNFC